MCTGSPFYCENFSAPEGSEEGRSPQRVSSLDASHGENDSVVSGRRPGTPRGLHHGML